MFVWEENQEPEQSHLILYRNIYSRCMCNELAKPQLKEETILPMLDIYVHSQIMLDISLH